MKSEPAGEGLLVRLTTVKSAGLVPAAVLLPFRVHAAEVASCALVMVLEGICAEEIEPDKAENDGAIVPVAMETI